MRALILAAMLVATAPVMSGCQTIPPGAATADEKALLAVERSYAAVLLSTNAAVDSGALKGADAAKASELLVTVKDQVKSARTLYDAGQIVQANFVIGQAQSTIDALEAIAK